MLSFTKHPLRHPYIWLHCIFKKVINTYSGSRYPGVPDIAVEKLLPDKQFPFSGVKHLDNPKSATLACNFSSNKMLAVLTSLWIIGGLQPLCKYSSATNSNPMSVSLEKR